MNENPPQTDTNMTPPPTMMQGGNEPERKYGPLIGIIIIITLLVVGGFYLWGSQIAERANVETTEEVQDEMTETLREQSTSDEVNAIEGDLEATSIESIDAELGDIESELEGELQVQ